MEKNVKKPIRKKRVAYWYYSAFFIFAILLSELTVRISAYGNLSELHIALFSFDILLALGLAYVCSFWKQIVGKILSYIFTVLLFIFYVVHLVYQHTFKSFLSISQVGMGGDALSSFGKETILSALEVKWYILLLLVPLITLIISNILMKRGKKKVYLRKLNLAQKIVFPIVIAILHIVCVLCLPLFGNGAYSPKDLYSDTFVLSFSEKIFGVFTSTRLEVKGLLFGTGGGSIITEDPGSEQPVTPVNYDDNVLDIDFAALAANEKDKSIQNLHNYFAARTPTKQNAYTGMFKGYNVVELVCESFSPYLIDEQRTPTLYKMAHDGIVLNNYYDTICDNTSNSEYTFINSNLPDTSLLGKGWRNFYDYNSCTVSKDNYLPMALGNLMKSEGYKSWGFHNYKGNYYGRKDTHPNFGFDFYYMNKGLKKTDLWPTSDLEMMEQAVPMILKEYNETGKPFSAYFLTFSGHMYYNFTSNKIAKANEDVSKDMNCGTAAKAYVSCNQELEYAIKYMIDEFEKAGILDKTIFIVTPDHYPYTLGFKSLSQIAGKDLEADDFSAEFNKYKSCCLFWSSSMTEPIIVNDVCCELDILPTLCNLLGFKYESRLMLGTDIFSPSEKIAILLDRSFVTKDGYYDANKDKVYTFGDQKGWTDEELNRLITSVKNKFTVSTEMLYKDYFKHLGLDQ